MLITIVAALEEPYEVITVSELCNQWSLLSQFLLQDGDERNCSQVFEDGDTNNNGFVGFHESIVFLAPIWGIDNYVHGSEKLAQIDCSRCLLNQSLYYL